MSEKAALITSLVPRLKSDEWNAAESNSSRCTAQVGV